MDEPAASEGSSPSEKLTDFDLPDEIEDGVEHCKNTKTFPFSHMYLEDPPTPDVLSIEECRLLYHACDFSKELESTNPTRFTLVTTCSH